MPAFVIVDNEVTDPEGFREYQKRVVSTLEPYEGKFLVRRGKYETLEGDWHLHRLILLEFPSVEQARRWYQSDGSEFVQVFLEGIFSLTIAGEGRSRDIDLLSNRGEHYSGNLFDFHESATRKLQEGQLNSESQVVGRASSTINKVSFFFGKGGPSFWLSGEKTKRNHLGPSLAGKTGGKNVGSPYMRYSYK